jgi:1-acyl-sn-glycerol-3-phosphate acyltransferase
MLQQDTGNGLEHTVRNRLIITDEEIEKNKEEYKRYFSLPYLNAFCRHVLSHVSNVWYRPQFVGFDKLPLRNNSEAPLVYATNHSGMAFPWDAIVFITQIADRRPDIANSIRALISPMLTKYPYMCPFLIDDLWFKAGCINATFLNFETAMRLNETNVLIFPEGIDGIGKGFDKRYQLQPFKTSFLRMSIRYKTDIIPFYTINGEYNNPFAYNVKPLTNFVRKFGMPFFPLGPVIFLAIFQPWIFYISLPSQLTFVMGEPIRVYDMVDKPYDQLSQKELKVIGESVRKTMQQRLEETQKKYGKKFYNVKSLLKAMWKHRRYFLRYFPPFWPLVMTYFDVNYNSTQGDESLRLTFRKCLKTIIKRPWVLAMYLPVLGWVVIALRSWWKMRGKSNR